jgi:hypothetical protein
MNNLSYLGKAKTWAGISMTLAMLFFGLAVLAAAEESENDDLVVLGGIELCAPIDPALDYLDPEPPSDTKAWKKWNKARTRAYKKDDDGIESWSFRKLPEGLSLEFGGMEPSIISVRGFEGDVLEVIVYYLSNHGQQERVWRDLSEKLQHVKGEPADDSAFGKVWLEGEKKTVAGWNLSGDYVVLGLTCRSLQDYQQRLEKEADQKKLGENRCQVRRFLAGNLKDRQTTKLRQVVATLGIERWEQRAGSLGGALGKHPDVVSRWARSGAERRSTEHEFAELLDELDTKLAEACSE